MIEEKIGKNARVANFGPSGFSGRSTGCEKLRIGLDTAILFFIGISPSIDQVQNPMNERPCLIWSQSDRGNFGSHDTRSFMVISFCVRMNVGFLDALLGRHFQII